MGVLFLCTANSCRSQMAEGFYRSIAQGEEVFSAGTRPDTVHPRAVEVMREVGVDISRQRSKGLNLVPDQRIDTVVTLCVEAADCPLPISTTQRIHWPIDDPAVGTGTEEELLAAFRRARDEIRANVLDLIRSRRSAEKA